MKNRKHKYFISESDIQDATDYIYYCKRVGNDREGDVELALDNVDNDNYTDSRQSAIVIQRAVNEWRQISAYLDFGGR